METAVGDTLQQVAGTLSASGERDAILFYQRETELRWSYAELDRQVGRLAAGLAGRGVGAEQPVAVIGGNSPHWILACLAILRCGATVVPLDAQLGDKSFAHILTDSGARLLFAGTAAAARHGERCREAGVTVIGLEDGADTPWTAVASDVTADFPVVGPEQRAALFYTSGTTGSPKGVPLSHRNLVHQLKSLAAADLVGDDERILQPLPLHHVYPFVVGTLTPLALGLPVILSGSFTGTQVLDALRRGRATMMIGVPRLYQALVDGLEERLKKQGGLAAALMRGLRGLSGMLYRGFGWRVGRSLLRPLHGRLAPDLRTLVSGGAALKPELGRQLEVIGWQVATGYGLTETSPMVAFDRPGQADFDTAGKPIPGTELRIDGSEQQPGEVLVRGPGVFAGYHNLEEKSREVLDADGWFHTGDLGWLGTDGRLHLAGRSSTLIVTEAGKNLQPDEIEEAYQRHPLIAEIAVFQRDGRLAGLIVPDLRAIGEEPVEAAMRRALDEIGRTLPAYQRLAEYATTREAIARTRLGKPRRHLIAERYEAARGETVSVSEADRHPIALDDMADDDRALLDEPAVAAAWALLAEKFADRRLTPDSDFNLDLGVDSIDWLDLSLEVAERSGVALSEAAIAEVATVRDLLHAVAEGETETARGSPLDDPEAALTDAQKAWLQPLGPVARGIGRVLHGLNWALMRALFLRRVEGREHLSVDGPAILAPNHLSYLDPFVLAAALEHRGLQRTYWAGWTGVVFTSALRRRFARIARVLPIDPDRAAASSLGFGAAALLRGNALIWFPEGIRSRDGRLQPFKAGLGMLIERHRVAVVPVVIDGTHTAWPPGRRLPRPKPVVIRFLPPRTAEDLEASGEGETAAARIVDGIRRDIAAALGEP
ncbi:MAG: AMP-binding protein [Alphaproteobacteria bacterium]